MKINRSPKFWLTIALALCVISMLGASYVQTNGGSVTVKDLRWETPSGKLMSALLFVPANATVKTPAPAIVAAHGWYNNREMQDMNFVEYSRRGYVVMAIDMYGHGNSDVLTGNAATRATGMTDAVELMATLPYVDKTKIGVTGHSNGARAANYAVDDDNAKAKPLIAAVLMVANDPTYKDANGKYYDKYGNRDVAVVASQFDEFFFRLKQADGSMSKPADYINQPTAQSFLNFGIDPATGGEVRKAGVLYTKNNGAVDPIRAIYTPYEIHPWNTVSSNVLNFSVTFFQAALGAPNPIPGTDQVWQYKAIFNVIGLVGFGMFVLAFAMVLLQTSFFSTLKAGEVVVAQPAPTGKSKAWFWVSLVLAAFVSGFSYLYLPALVNTPGFRPVFFLQAPVFFIGVWAVTNGLFAAVLMLIGWFFFGGKSVSLKDRGITLSLSKLWKTILLALAVVAGAYAIVFVSDYMFKVDFRVWVIAVKAFTPDKFGIILMYLPFFLVFYVLHSVAVNSFNYVNQGKEWINVAVLALFTTLGALAYVVIQYVTFFSTGKSWTEVMNPAISNIYGIWLFPVLLFFPLAVIFDRQLYKVTRNPYLGGITFALLMTIIACTNTLGQLP
jgi:dienelactone hydrolase